MAGDTRTHRCELGVGGLVTHDGEHGNHCVETRSEFEFLGILELETHIDPGLRRLLAREPEHGFGSIHPDDPIAPLRQPDGVPTGPTPEIQHIQNPTLGSTQYGVEKIALPIVVLLGVERIIERRIGGREHIGGHGRIPRRVVQTSSTWASVTPIPDGR